MLFDLSNYGPINAYNWEIVITCLFAKLPRPEESEWKGPFGFLVRLTPTQCPPGYH